MTKKKSKSESRMSRAVLKSRDEFITSEMQKAKGLRKITKGLLAAQAKKNERLKDKVKDKEKGGTDLGNALRILGQEKTGMWIDRFFGSRSEAPKEKDSEKKSSAAGQAVVKTVAQNSGQIKIISKKLDTIGGMVNVISDDVVDIKNLLMPRGVVAKGKKGTDAEGQTQFVQFNPLSPSGEQMRQVTESGKLTPKKPGANFKDSATQQAALETARLALKIQKEEEAKSQLRMKYRYKDPKESDPIVGQDPVAGLRVDINNKFKELNEKVDGMKDEGGIFSDLWEFIKNLSFFKMLKPFVGLLMGIGRLGLVGLAAWAGYQIGTWIYDKIAPYLLDAMQWVGDKIKWATEKFVEIKDWVLGLPERIIAIFKDPFGINKRREEAARKKEAENAAAGRTRGGVASAKGPDMDKSIEHYDKLSKDAKATKEQRAAAAKARDTLIGVKMKTPEGVPTNIPAPEPRGRQVRPVAKAVSKPVSKQTNLGEGGGTLSKKEAGMVISGQEDIKKMIMEHEGVRYRPYKDSLGLWTVGVGHLIGDGKTLPPEWDREFSKEEVMALFEEDYAHHRKQAEKIPGFAKLNTQGQGALTDLTFNMGPNWIKKFPSVAKALSENPPNVALAASILEGSKWYGQVGRRAPRIVSMVKAGLDPSTTAPFTPAPDTGVTPEIRMASASSTGKVTPAPTVSGAAVDGSSRQVAAAQSSVPVIINSPTNVSAPVMASNSPVPKTPLPKASVTNRDDSFVRTASRDVPHPTLA